MREFKFKAWNVTNGEFYPDHMIVGITMDGKLLRYCGSGAREDNEFEYKIMQYTGLKDKNGVEIYEGDIVQYKMPGETRKSHVIYESSSFRFKEGTMHKDDINEVIGNIFENPDLLE